VVLCAAILAGQPPARAPVAGAPERIVVSLRVNGDPRGDVFLIRADNEWWIRTSRLSGSGLAHFTGTERIFNAETYAALSSLAPGIVFELDEDALELRLTAEPEAFERTDVVLQNRRPQGLEYSRTTGFFLNYDTLFQQDSRTSVTLEAGLSVGTALATTSYTRTADDEIVRGLSSLTIDAPKHMLRVVVGDTSSRPTLLGSLTTVGGVSIGREFSLDPYQTPYPLPAVAGSVSTPAVAEVYVNGTIVRRERLPPGPFSLQRLPVVGGLGSMQVVVRDRLGREQVFGGPYYFTSSLLDKGTRDFEYLIGAAREDQSGANPTYGDLTGSIVHRVGLTEWLTLGARGEGDPHVVSGGPMVNVRIGRVGEIEAEGAVSGSAGYLDYAAAANYQFTTQRFTVSTTAQWLRPHFATLGLSAEDSRHALRANATASVSLGRTTVSGFYTDNSGQAVAEKAPQASTPVPLTFDAARTVDPPSANVTPEKRAGSTLYLQFGKRMQATISAARVISEQATKGWDGFASLTLLLGPRAVASAGVNQSGDGTTNSVVTLQKSLPLGTGVGYRVESQSSSTGLQSGRAEFQTQTRYGLIALREDASAGRNVGSAELSGSVVVAGGQMRLGRSITDGYAVVQIPDNPGVRVYVNNQLAGRTGRGGTIIVPNLLPYYANPVRIADEDIALEYQLSRTSALVAPPNRGPALVRFTAVLFRGVSGRVVVDGNGEPLVPAFGDISVDMPDRDPQKSPIGGRGEFYLENLPEGKTDVRVDYQNGSCHATFEVPADIRIAVDVGEITCRPDGL